LAADYLALLLDIGRGPACRRMAAAASMGDERDIKGLIPLYTGSNVPAFGGVFKAVPHCLGEALKPFESKTTHEQPAGVSRTVEVEQRTYIVPAGQEYFVRCTQLRQQDASGRGTHFGARVFVDRGTGNDAALGEEDHIFWFDPAEVTTGQNSLYDVYGYFETSQSELKFVFQRPHVAAGASAAASQQQPSTATADAALKPIGCVAIHFAEVDEMTASDPRAKRQRRQPQVVTLPNHPHVEDLARKSHTSVSTGAGNRFVRPAPQREAKLSSETVHVEVMRFVDFGAALSMSNGQLFKNLSTFNAIPLPVFTQVQTARCDCLVRLLQELQASRYDVELSIAASDQVVNNAVAVTDFVELVDRFVSPAGSYILCTGQIPPPGRYHETLVQAEPAQTGQTRDGREKEQALAAFLRGNPDRFEVTWRKYEDGALQVVTVEDLHKCSITHEIMIDPVVDCNGHSYERSKIQQWIENPRPDGSVLSPLTGDVLANHALTDNITLRQLIENKNYTKDYYVRRHVVSLRVGTATDAPVTCHFRFQSGEVETVVVDKTQPLGNAFITVAARNGTPVSALRFIFDGQRLDMASTPANEHVADGEDMLIDVFYEMLGGRSVSINNTHIRAESMKP
jgi:hypothetical protein